MLKMAEHKNVSVKISGACTMSREAFPFNDIWDPVCRMIDAFGLDRCMWGTDWTRAAPVVDYKPAVDAFRVTNRFTDSDREKLMGGSLMKIYNWKPTGKS
jgi:predicted TIM-barrel fold metal-dependent hydrolase